jgi:hypothetical protein
MKAFLIALFAITLLFFSVVKAEIYKWKDAKGQIYYASVPPKPSDKISSLEKNILSLHAKANTANTADKKNKPLSKISKKKRIYCDKNIKNLKLLKNNIIVTWIEKGKEIQLSGRLRDDKIESLATDLRDNCDFKNE